MFEYTEPKNLNSLDQAVAMINQAQKPVIYIGKGARSASSDIIKLAEKISAAIIESLGAKGVIPATHASYLGGIGIGGTLESSELLKQSDCILMIGANWYPSGFVPNQTQIIKIDISPSNIESQRDVSIGIVGDAAEILPILVGKIEVNRRAEWFDLVSSTKATITQKLDRERKPNGSVITPQVSSPLWIKPLRMTGLFPWIQAIIPFGLIVSFEPSSRLLFQGNGAQWDISRREK
jgi:pyruvate oxidase